MVAENFKKHVDNLLEENINNVWQLIDTSKYTELNYLVGGMFVSPSGHIKSSAYTQKSSKEVLDIELKNIALKNTNDYRYLTNNEYVAYKYEVLTHKIRDRNI